MGVAVIADRGCRSQRLRLQIAAFEKDRAGAFHFIERATDVARLQLNSAAAVQHDMRVQSEAPTIQYARRVRYPDDHCRFLLRSLFKE